MKAWRKFCASIGVSWDLDGLIGSGQAAVIKVLCRFLAHEMIRGMAATSVHAYMKSVIRFMETDTRPIASALSEAWDHPLIKRAMAGYTRMYYQAHDIAANKREPMMPSMIRYKDEALDSVASLARPRRVGLARSAESLALRLGLAFMLRKSEFLPVKHRGTWRKGIPLDCVRLIDIGGKVIPTHLIGRVTAVKLAVTIRRSKTDQHGVGRTRVIAAPGCRNSAYPPRCLVSDMVVWLVSLRDAGACFLPPEQGGDGLFFLKGVALIDQIHCAYMIKTIARFIGLDPSVFSCHSLRYGGVCMLASSGVPRYLIEYHGGWAKDSSALTAVYLHVSNVPDVHEVGHVLSTWEDSSDLSGVWLRHSSSMR